MTYQAMELTRLPDYVYEMSDYSRRAWMTRVATADVVSTIRCECGSLMTVERTGVEVEWGVPYHVRDEPVPTRTIQMRVAFCNACDKVEVL